MDLERAAWAAKYAREPAPWRGPQLLDARHRAALDGLPRGARALEVGAAGGKTLAALAATGLRAVALDWVEAGGVEVVADARALPFRDRSFEAVALFHVIDHALAEGRARMLREAARVLADGGVVAGRVFHADDRRAAIGEPAGEPGTRRRGGVLAHAFDESELAAALDAAFRDVQVWKETRAEKHAGEASQRALLLFLAGSPRRPSAGVK